MKSNLWVHNLQGSCSDKNERVPGQLPWPPENDVSHRWVCFWILSKFIFWHFYLMNLINLISDAGHWKGFQIEENIGIGRPLEIFLVNFKCYLINEILFKVIAIQRNLEGKIIFVSQMTIAEITILLPYLSVKSLQLIWRLGTQRWNLWVPYIQMSCRDLTTW